MTTKTAVVDLEEASEHIGDVATEPSEQDKRAGRAAKYSDARARRVCESLLFVADRPLGEKAIQEITGLKPARIRAAMDAIGGAFREGASGIVLHEVASGWQLRTCSTNRDDVRRMLQVKPHRLTRASLETMSIVAYRQPVTRPEVEEIRGVDCGAILKSLLERGLVQVLGKKEEPGRPLLYGTTRAFLEFFDLKDLASLPTLREFQELSEEHHQIVEDSYPESEQKVLEGLLGAAPLEDAQDDEGALDQLDQALEETHRRNRALRASLDGHQAANRDVPDEAGEEVAPDAAPPDESGTR